MAGRERVERLEDGVEVRERGEVEEEEVEEEEAEVEMLEAEELKRCEMGELSGFSE